MTHFYFLKLEEMARQVKEDIFTDNLGHQSCYLYQFKIRDDWEKDIDSQKYQSSPAPILDITTGEPIPGTGDITTTRTGSTIGHIPSFVTRSDSGVIQEIGNCAPYAFYVAKLMNDEELIIANRYITYGYGGAYPIQIVEFLNRKFEGKNFAYMTTHEKTRKFDERKKIKETLKNLQPGFYTFLSVNWVVGGGHIFIVHRNPKDKKLYCLEPQLKSRGVIYYFPLEEMESILSFDTNYFLEKGDLVLAEERTLYIDTIYDIHRINDWGAGAVIGVYKDYGKYSMGVFSTGQKVYIKYHGQTVFQDMSSEELKGFNIYMRNRQAALVGTITASFPVKKGQFTTITELGKIRYPDRDGHIVMCNNSIQNIYFSPIDPMNISEIFIKGILGGVTENVKFTNCFQHLDFKEEQQKSLFICVIVNISAINFITQGYSYQNIYDEFCSYVNQIEDPDELDAIYVKAKNIKNNPDKYAVFFQQILDHFSKDTYIEQFIENTQFSGLQNGMTPNVNFIPETFKGKSMYGNCAIYALYSLGMRSYEEAKQNTECLASRAAGPATVETIQQYFRYYYPGFQINVRTKQFVEGGDYKSYLMEEFKDLREGFLAPIFLYYGKEDKQQGFHMTSIGRLNLEGSGGVSILYILDTQSAHIGYPLITALDKYNFPLWRIDTFYKKYDITMTPLPSIGFRPVTLYDDSFPLNPWKQIITEYNTNPIYTPELGEKIYRASLNHPPTKEDPQVMYYINGRIFTRGLFDVYEYPGRELEYIPVVEIEAEGKHRELYVNFREIIQARSNILKNIMEPLNGVFTQNNIPFRVVVSTDGEIYKIADITPDTTTVTPGVPAMSVPTKTVNVPPVPVETNVTTKPIRIRKKKKGANNTHTIPSVPPMIPPPGPSVMNDDEPKLPPIIPPQGPSVMNDDEPKVPAVPQVTVPFQPFTPFVPPTPSPGMTILEQYKYILDQISNRQIRLPSSMDNGGFYHGYEDVHSLYRQIGDLLEANPDLVNVQSDNTGFTFLMAAIIDNHPSVVQTLFEKLPGINISLIVGRSLGDGKILPTFNAMDIAFIFHRQDIIPLLLQKYYTFVGQYTDFLTFQNEFIKAINIHHTDLERAINLLYSHPEFIPHVINVQEPEGNTFFMVLIRYYKYDYARHYMNVPTLHPFLPNLEGYYPQDYISDESIKQEFIRLTWGKLLTLYRDGTVVVRGDTIRTFLNHAQNASIIGGGISDTEVKIVLQRGDFSLANELFRYAFPNMSVKYSTGPYNRGTGLYANLTWLLNDIEAAGNNYYMGSSKSEREAYIELHKFVWKYINPGRVHYSNEKRESDDRNNRVNNNLGGGGRKYKKTRRVRPRGILKKNRGKTYRKKHL